MKIAPIACIASILVLIPGAHGQKLEVVPSGELQQKREQVKQALAAWHKVDAGIEGRIFRLKADQAMRDLDQAAERARLWVEARDSYNQAMVRQATEQVDTLEALASGVGSIIPSDELLGSTQRRLDNLDMQEKELMRLGSKKDEAIPHERQVLIDEQVQLQLKKILELRQNLRDEQELIRRTREAARPFEPARVELLNHSKEVLRILEEETERTRTEGGLWQEYYQSLKSLVRSNHGSKEAPGAVDQKGVRKKS